jgi:uncharacterized protein
VRSLILLFTISIFLGIILSFLIAPTPPKIEIPFQAKEISKRMQTTLIPINITYESPVIAMLKVPAVDNEGKGVITTLKVRVIPGEGRILTDIHQLLFWVDTQHSIRVAKKVAEAITEINTSNIDLIYSIETNASIIGGESAGAAITLATIAALQNKTIRKDVVITGTIQEDGSIGQVGAVLEKGRASKNAGATLFLVPIGQGKYKEYVPEIKCKEYSIAGFYQKICTSEYKLKEVDISKDIGIEVKEVSDIKEAMKYFFE